MTLITMTEAKQLFGIADDRTFKTVAQQYKLKRIPVGQRVKFDKDEIKRKLNLNAQ